MDLRSQAHAALDDLLDSFPDTSAVLLVVDGRRMEAASVPNALSVKRGMIDSAYELIHPECEA